VNSSNDCIAGIDLATGFEDEPFDLGLVLRVHGHCNYGPVRILRVRLGIVVEAGDVNRLAELERRRSRQSEPISAGRRPIRETPSASGQCGAAIAGIREAG
jgi:hypothetical protein